MRSSGADSQLQPQGMNDLQQGIHGGGVIFFEDGRFS